MRRWLLALALVWCGLSLNNIYPYNLRQIADKEYMSNSSITSLCQNERGVMWIGTCDGLNIYDGRSIETLKMDEGNDYFSGNLIDNIAYAGNDVYWIQTYYGLNKLDRRLNRVTHFDEFRKQFFMNTDGNGNLFVVKDDNRVFYYHPRKMRFETLEVSGVTLSEMLCLFIDGNNHLWAVMRNGVYSFGLRHDEDTGDISLMSAERITLDSGKPLLYCFSDGEYLYYIDKGFDLFSWNIAEREGTFVANLEAEVRKRGKISSVVRFHDSYFVGFLVNGVICLEKQSQADGYRSQALPVNSGVFCLRKDRFQNVVWIGTDGKGVYMYSNPLYSIRSVSLDNYRGMIGCPVRALFLDKENTFWIGTKGNGILKIYNYHTDGNIPDFRSEMVTGGNSQLGSNSVYCFAESRRGILWIGDEDGLNYYSYRERQVRKLPLKADGKDFKYIHDIYEADEHNLWLASVGMGIVRIHLSGTPDHPVIDQVKRYVINGGAFDSNYFFSIYADRGGRLLFGNKGYGAYRYDRQRDELVSVAIHGNESMTLNNILDINGTGKGSYLFGTSFGLIKTDADGSYHLFNTEHGFQNNTIHSVLEDDGVRFWLSTNTGLVLFNSKQNSFRTYGFGDGLDVLEFSDGAAFRDARTGTLFFGGINGFVSIQKDGLPEPVYMPSVHFDKLSVFGKECNRGEFFHAGHDGKEVLDLKYNQNFFSVSFSAVDYLTGNDCKFFYKLKGLSDRWIDNGSERAVSFTNMAHGEYTLLVKYRNEVFGLESQEYPLVIRIAAPWWASWWAYVIYALLGAGAVSLVVYSLILRSRRKKRELLNEIERRHQKNVFESKLRFFMNIAREFCTPLTLIYGPCGRILSSGGLSSLVVSYVRMIQTNAERLNGLIHELIEFRHIETGSREAHVETLKVSSILKELARTFVDVAKSRDITFLSKQPNDIRWNSDGAFLNTILTNLISNSFRMADDGTTIRMDAATEDNNFVFRISCNGKEAERKEMERMFRQYVASDYTGWQDEEGFSRDTLGLALSYRMVKLLGGELTLRQLPDGQMEFSLLLPWLEVASDATGMGQTISDYMMKTGGMRSATWKPVQAEFDKTLPVMLVLENDTEMLWFIGDLFSHEFNIIPLQNVELVRQTLGEVYPHIIICDDMMPGLDTVELTKYVKSAKETAHIPIIILSGKHDMELQIQALDAGVEMFVPKPFSADYLRISVRQVMERKEILKNYFSSPISSFEKVEGKLTHKESKTFLKNVLKIINGNITSKELSPHFIAEQLAMSPRSLYRRMSEIGVDSLTDMIRDSRLHVAKSLLLTTKKTIDEIVYDSGFSNKVTFFKAFKEKYGCTPREFRKKHLEEIG